MNCRACGQEVVWGRLCGNCQRTRKTLPREFRVGEPRTAGDAAKKLLAQLAPEKPKDEVA